MDVGGEDGEVRSKALCERERESEREGEREGGHLSEEDLFLSNLISQLYCQMKRPSNSRSVCVCVWSIVSAEVCVSSGTDVSHPHPSISLLIFAMSTSEPQHTHVHNSLVFGATVVQLSLSWWGGGRHPSICS